MSGPFRNRFARKDANHKPLCSLWLAWGGSIIDMSSLSGGVPDTLLSVGQRDTLVEFKMPGNKLTEDQASFVLKHRGSPLVIVETENDLRALFIEMAGTQPTEPVKNKSAKN